MKDKEEIFKEIKRLNSISDDKYTEMASWKIDALDWVLDK